MYKTEAANPQGGPTPGAEHGAQSGTQPGAEKPKDNVVDAEFVDVDDKK